MSFGFSVSDIYGCARLAYTLYEEFKQAPGACQEFSSELLLFHRVLRKTIECGTNDLNVSDQNDLETCLASCNELLYVQILGALGTPKDSAKIEFMSLGKVFPGHLDSDHIAFLPRVYWRRKFKERSFALRIPAFQRAISALIEKLTAFNIMHIQSRQSDIHASQLHIEEGLAESHDLLVKSSSDHALQLDTLTNRFETSQTRIEEQLQIILANQQRSKTPIMPHSLDASSPEGRQTWMELGRLLRDEGITPAMIQKNRGLLVNAMKTTLNNETALGQSAPESYATAPEYYIDNSITTSLVQPRNAPRLGLPPAPSPMSLLGSAPPRTAGFTNAFLKRQNGAGNSLDQEQNVDDGMQSLLQGMSRENFSEEQGQDDDSYAELGDVELDPVFNPGE